MTPLAVSALLLTIATASGEPAVVAEGIWYKPIPDVEGLIPVGDGKHAWAWNHEHVIVVDGAGDPLKTPGIPIASRDIVYEVLPWPNGQSAWIVHKDSIDVADVNGNYRRVEIPRDEREEEMLESYSPVPHWGKFPRLWLTPRYSFLHNNLLSIDADGKVSAVSLHDDEPSMDASRLKVTTPTGGLWLARDSLSATLSRLWHIDATGTEKRLDQLAKGGLRIRDAKGISDGAFLWVPGAQRGLYLFRDTGASWVVPFMKNSEIRVLAASGDNSRAWVATDDGVFALNGEAEPKLVLPQSDIKALIPVGSREVLAVTKNGERTAIREDGTPVTLDRLVSGEGSIVDAVVTMPRGILWLVERDGRVVAFEPTGHAVNGGSPVATIEGDPPRTGSIALPDDHLLVPGRDAVELSIGLSGVETVADVGMGFAGALSDDKRFAWLVGHDGRPFAYRIGGRQYRGTICTFGCPSYGDIFPIAGTQNVWTSVGSSWLGDSRLTPHVIGVIDSPAGLGSAEISVGKSRLSAKDATGMELPMNAIHDPWGVALDWRGRAGDPGGTVTLQVLEPDGRSQLAWGQGPSKDKRIPVGWDRDPAADQQYQVVVGYTDPFGTNVHVTWKRVSFVLPWWQRWGLPTFFAFAVLLVVSIVLARFGALNGALRQWMPIAVSLASGGVGTLPAVAQATRINGLGLLGLTCAACVIGIALGAVSPDVFKMLAAIQPFSSLAGPLMRVPRLRRRLYAEHVKNLGALLEAQRADRFRESFVTLPATVSTVGAEASSRVDDPAQHAAAVLGASSDGPHIVLFEAAGGRGKSALFRETVGRLTAQFVSSPRSPLPVVCSPEGMASEDDLIGAVRRALGRCIYIDEKIPEMIASGELVVAFDGPPETDKARDAIRDLVRGERGRNLRLLLAMRPNRKIREVLGGGCRIEPSILDAQTLPTFEEHYGVKLSDALRSACHNDDGYVPILVRLAQVIQAKGRNASSVAELYDEFILLQLPQKDGAPDRDTLHAAAGLCVATYWRTGDRVLAYERADAEEGRLLEALFKAGIVISADDSPGAVTPRPRQVRFFHDSAQGYLTALGLFLEAQKKADWSILAEVAGHPGFTKIESLEAGGGELLRFCFEVFRPDAQLLREVREQLNAWAREHGSRLSSETVMKLAPADVIPLVEQACRELATGALIEKIVTECERKYGANSLDVVRRLTPLYVKLASLAREQRAEEEKSDGSARAAPLKPAATVRSEG